MSPSEVLFEVAYRDRRDSGAMDNLELQIRSVMYKTNVDPGTDPVQADDLQQPIIVHTALDITPDICPMTFVRTRLALDRLPVGAVLAVRLKGAEPLENVPRMAATLGHTVLRCETSEDGVTSLWIRRG